MVGTRQSGRLGTRSARLFALAAGWSETLIHVGEWVPAVTV